MFESILEKILQKHLGYYIEGIDSNNLKLGVWSGNIIIENVSLNSKIFELLDIPLLLIFSSIGKMRVSIPWNKLSSTPVEVILENLYIVLGPKNHSHWTSRKNRILYEKLALIEKVKEDFLRKIMSKNVKQEEIPSSYKEKLTKLIVDNMQITINNIHVRFENEKNNYAFGITLESFVMSTTDDQWKKNFLNRTEIENKEKPINKLLSIKNLRIYWSYAEKIFHQKENALKEKILKSLENLSNNTKNQMLNINAEAKIIHNKNTNNFKIPETSLNLQLKTIDFVISQTQLQQMIRLVEFFQSYSVLLINNKNLKNIEIENEETIDPSIESKFQSYFTKIYLQKEQKLKEPLSEAEKLEYNEIISQTSSKIIQKWTKLSLK